VCARECVRERVCERVCVRSKQQVRNQSKGAPGEREFFFGGGGTSWSRTTAHLALSDRRWSSNFLLTNLSFALAHTLSRTLSRAHSHTLTLSHSHSLTLTTHSLAHTLTLSHSHSLTLTSWSRTTAHLALSERRWSSTFARASGLEFGVWCLGFRV